MKNKTLLIMAAGMGSRFGGLKQIEPIGPNGEFLIDYSIYDAVQEGFNKVVFIIKRENYGVFKETIGSRVDKYIQVEYAFQDLIDIPDSYTIPSDRIKPFGTTHAILQAKDLISEPFAVINADDFYGRDAYRVVANFLNNSNDNEYCVVGYLVENTLSANGSVKRAVCQKNKDRLIDLIESSIVKENGIITATPLNGNMSMTLNSNDLVSMNLFGFKENIFTFLENDFQEFLNSNPSITDECFIPESLKKSNNSNHSNVSVLLTTAKWYGITYKEDKKDVIDAIKNMINDGIYPNNLWE